MQQATLLYNDRVVTYKQMKQLDERLDQKPTKKEIMLMAELRVRNLQAFDELQSFNNTGRFLYVHPLIKDYSEKYKLEQMRKNEPEKFLDLYKRCQDNVRRYKSFMTRKDRTDKRMSDKEHLQYYLEKSNLFKLIMQQQ